MELARQFKLPVALSLGLIGVRLFETFTIERRAVILAVLLFVFTSASYVGGAYMDGTGQPAWACKAFRLAVEPFMTAVWMLSLGLALFGEISAYFIGLSIFIGILTVAVIVSRKAREGVADL